MNPDSSDVSSNTFPTTYKGYILNPTSTSHRTVVQGRGNTVTQGASYSKGEIRFAGYRDATATNDTDLTIKSNTTANFIKYNFVLVGMN